MRIRIGTAISPLGFLIMAAIVGLLTQCKPSARVTDSGRVSSERGITWWLTKGNQTVKLQKQPTALLFAQADNQYLTIETDERDTFQTIEGFGYTLTGGSAQVMNQLAPATKKAILQELFGSDSNAISISYLRLSIGASDLNATPFTYNDMPLGQSDPQLTKFSLAPDMAELVPLLKEILQINPTIKIMASPWSAPVWMKDNGSFKGGSLQPQYYEVYAQYFVKYIQQMKALGISIAAVTPQNEPLHPGNTPSMLMTAAQQAGFIKNNLGPAFQKAKIAANIVIYDHNCDNPQYPLSILNDPAAKQFVHGTAFHLYAGDIHVLSDLHNAHPDRDIYFTEQYTSSTGDFDGDLKWHLKNVIIGSMRNWSKNALEWNLANDAGFGPHTIGGCSVCKGAITVDGSSTITRNVGYYIIAHASKFVPPGSVRLGSNISGNLHNVFFKTPAGKRVLVVENDGETPVTFNIKYRDKWATAALDGADVATYIW
jgi:O-glycosyl hydrolase